MKYDSSDFCKLCLTSGGFTKPVASFSISKKADKATALVLMAGTFWDQSGSQSSQISEFVGLRVLIKSYPEQPDNEILIFIQSWSLYINADT